MRSRRRRLIAALAIGLIATAIGAVTYATDAFDDTENDSQKHHIVRDAGQAQGTDEYRSEAEGLSVPTSR